MRSVAAALSLVLVTAALVATTAPAAFADKLWDPVDECGISNDVVTVADGYFVEYDTVDSVRSWTVYGPDPDTLETVSRASGTFTEVPCEFDTTPTTQISGTTKVGALVTAVVVGTWAPTPDAIGFQWFRNAVAIVGATAASYAISSVDVGANLTVAATATKSEFSDSVSTSIPTAKVVNGTFILSLPTIVGSANVGKWLTATTNAWSPAPETLSYRWRRDGATISGATQSTYRLVTADAGKSITVMVTARSAGYTTAWKTSLPRKIAKVLTARPTPTISGTARYGYTLAATIGTWKPSPVALSYRWLRNGVAITGAIGKSYKLTKADAGQLITFRVTAKKSGYTTTIRTSAGKRIANAPANPGDTKNCSNFTSRAAAQAWFNLYYPWYGDVARLDGDNDKIACESLR